jgi:prepilin-type N-terminal cleavage/methylation domain-containing protein
VVEGKRVRCCERRPGFTLVELVIVTVVGAILLGIAAPRFVAVKERRAAQNARDAFVWAAATARALAIERGSTVALELDPATRQASIRHAGESVQRIDFGVEYGAGVSTGGGLVRICYAARGFALQASCSQNLPADISFTRGEQVSTLRVQAMGQVDRK